MATVTETTPRPMAPTLNLNDIRAVLSDEVQLLRDGASTPGRIAGVTNAVGKIMTSIKLEMEYLRLSGQKVDLEFLNPGDIAKP